MHNIKKGEWYGEDITKIRGQELPKADCWCFGFPCTNIRITGRQTGLQGEQSGLFFEVIRLLAETKKENKPRWLFIENVRNLLSVNKGFDFAGILLALNKAGYDTQWQVLDSANFGVPQHRERLYIVGHIRGSSGRKIFPTHRQERADSRRLAFAKAKVIDHSQEKVNLLESNKKAISRRRESCGKIPQQEE